MGSKRLPRSRRGASEWASHLEAQARSGLGVAAYCRQASISESSFYYWRARQAKRRAASSVTALAPTQAVPGFVEVLRSAPPRGYYRLELRNGHALEAPKGFAVDEVRALVGIVAERG